MYYDESKTFAERFFLLKYAIAFNDIHNFWLPVEKYRSLFREEYLNSHLPIDDIEMDSIMVIGDYSKQFMKWENRVEERKRIDVWKDRNFPDTRAENLKILDDYLTLCEENNVVPIIFLPPMPEGYKKHFSRQKLDEYFSVIQHAISKHPTTKFFDGWQLQEITDADFLDIIHLNCQGAEKFAVALNDFIEKI